MSIPTFLTRPLAGIALAVALSSGGAVAMAPAASASTPCSTGPNYCHVDSDGIEAVTTGASLRGRLYWENNTTSHFTVTLTDTLQRNNMPAYAQWRLFRNGVWSNWMNIHNSAEGSTYTWSSYTQPNMSVITSSQVQLRTRQGTTASWAYDTNSFRGD